MLFQIIVQAYQIYDISVQDTISCTTRPLIQLRRDFKLDMIVKRRFLTTGYLIMFEYHDDIFHIHSLSRIQKSEINLFNYPTGDRKTSFFYQWRKGPLYTHKLVSKTLHYINIVKKNFIISFWTSYKLSIPN